MCLYPVYLKTQSVPVPCGKCVECRIKKSTEWSYRICLEASLYDKNCMLTLTYNEDNLPDGQTLSIRDYQLFIKRLRKHLGTKRIRYFLCGEYGDKKGRPHFHVIVFNYYPDDAYYFFTDKKGVKLYRSPTIEKLWTKGFSTVGEVTLDTAKYCALYLQKAPKDGRLKPFQRMSLKPGIGANAVLPEWLLSDKIYLQGRYIKIPRYYLELLSREGYVDLDKFKREMRKSSPDLRDIDVQKAELKMRRKKFERIFKQSIDFVKKMW